jgi:hypothetical protein
VMLSPLEMIYFPETFCPIHRTVEIDSGAKLG